MRGSPRRRASVTVAASRGRGEAIDDSRPASSPSCYPVEVVLSGGFAGKIDIAVRYEHNI